VRTALALVLMKGKVLKGQKGAFRPGGVPYLSYLVGTYRSVGTHKLTFQLVLAKCLAAWPMISTV
jgi:hypothetical protein